MQSECHFYANISVFPRLAVPFVPTSYDRRFYSNSKSAAFESVVTNMGRSETPPASAALQSYANPANQVIKHPPVSQFPLDFNHAVQLITEFVSGEKSIDSFNLYSSTGIDFTLRLAQHSLFRAQWDLEDEQRTMISSRSATHLLPWKDILNGQSSKSTFCSLVSYQLIDFWEVEGLIDIEEPEPSTKSDTCNSRRFSHCATDSSLKCAYPFGGSMARQRPVSASL